MTLKCLVSSHAAVIDLSGGQVKWTIDPSSFKRGLTLNMPCVYLSVIFLDPHLRIVQRTEALWIAAALCCQSMVLAEDAVA